MSRYAPVPIQFHAMSTGSLVHVFCVYCGYLDTYICTEPNGIKKAKKTTHVCAEYRIERATRREAFHRRKRRIDTRA